MRPGAKGSVAHFGFIFASQQQNDSGDQWREKQRQKKIPEANASPFSGPYCYSNGQENPQEQTAQ
jgi:hypothetical protein